MWRTRDGLFNTIRPFDPRVYLSHELSGIIDSMSDLDKVALDISVTRYREIVIVSVLDSPLDDEDQFTNVELPEGYGLVVDPNRPLLEGLISQFERTPLRWRLEQVDLVPQYVTDYGPTWKKYRKLARKITNS